MSLPIAPEGFQGDLVDPVTGERLMRLQTWWERLARRADTLLAPPAPLAEPEPEPPAEPPRGRWSRAHGFIIGAQV